jgi:hypothetical protein
MLKRTFVMVLALAALLLPTLAQETSGSVFVTGGVLTVEDESLTIEGLSNALPAFVLVDGAPVPSYMATDLFANGWASVDGLTATAQLQLETGATADDFQYVTVPVTLSAPQYDNGGSMNDASDDVLTFTVTYDLDAAMATAGDGSEATMGVNIEALQDSKAFSLVIDYSGDFVTQLQAGIEDYASGGRLTTSRPCNPRSAC